MAKKKGICRNFDNCDLADNHEIQEVESTEFFCEECGKPLYEVTSGKGGGGKKKLKTLPMIIGGVVVLLAIGAAVIFGGGKKSSKTLDSTEKASISVQQAEDSPSPKPAAQQAEDSPSPKPAVQQVEDSPSPKPAVQQAEDSSSPKPAVQQVEDRPSPKPAPSSSSNSTLNLSYGKYTGSVKNGYPHGQGKLVYTKSRQINKRDVKARMANPGDYVVGEFANGFFVNGRLYNSKGELQSTVNIGMGPSDSYESK